MRDRGHMVELPHGLFDEDGACHRTAVLRPVTGHEELLLAELGAAELGADGGAAEVSELLAATLLRLGGYDHVDGELAGALTRGDRQFLVLQLRASLYGDRISLVVRCPSPSCRALSDVDVRISDMAPAAAEPRRWITCETPSGEAQVREPTGADDLATGRGDRGDRAAQLWARLVMLAGERVDAEGWRALPAATRHRIALALADGSRAPELFFLARCPTCGAGLEMGLDPFALLARELKSGGDRMLAEIHALAFHYHWPESEILALPRARRWRYLQLLGRELDGRPLLEAWS
jgi:hypothetical protein